MSVVELSMNSAIISRCKILVFLLVLLLVWQAVKFIPWSQPLKEREYDFGPAPSGTIQPVLVSVFYEALCPDSKNFIVKHLLPAVNKAPRLLNVSLVPYGKAKTEENINGSLTFTCQHGPTECLANKIHACAISTISNPILQVRYISCMISANMIPELIGQNCARELAVDWELILQCTYSEKGNTLLKEFGKITDAAVPRISFVPTVLLDNKFKNQASILKDFFKELCSMFKELPEECTQMY